MNKVETIDGISEYPPSIDLGMEKIETINEDAEHPPTIDVTHTTEEILEKYFTSITEVVTQNKSQEIDDEKVKDPWLTKDYISNL